MVCDSEERERERMDVRMKENKNEKLDSKNKECNIPSKEWKTPKTDRNNKNSTPMTQETGTLDHGKKNN